MATVWFVIIALMLAAYVVLDGFDFGAGILHLLVARNDEERRTVLGAVGPVWDGNEVWLIASGGMTFFAFPRAYAAGFSGFYLPLMLVLWLLILRGLSIEFRSKEENKLWRSLWDGLFFVSSSLMAIVLGAALGNLVRGVPLDATGFFEGPFFTNFKPGMHPGVLDWYTVSVGIFTLLALAGHGAMYLNWKTSGPVQERSRALASKIWAAVVLVGIGVTAETQAVQPLIFHNLHARPFLWPFAILALVCLGIIFTAPKRGKELPAFLTSSGFLVGMLGATAFSAYPNILISSIAPQYTVNVFNGHSGAYSLQAGMTWWIAAILLAIGYFIYLFRSFRGKVEISAGGH